LLLDTAISCGATVKFDSKVTAIDPSNKRVELSTGEVVEGDIIIGADGVNGLCRALLTEGAEGKDEHTNNVYTCVFVGSSFRQCS
jgi:salicylate hydroxylase